MANNDSIDISSITIQVNVIKSIDCTFQLQEIANNILVEDLRVKNEKITHALLAYAHYNTQKRISQDIRDEMKEFQIQQAILKLKSKIAKINLYWKKNDAECNKIYKRAAKENLKESLKPVNHIHVKNMMIKSIYTHKMIMLNIFGDSKLPTGVMNTILQYTSVAFVWVDWMESQDKETIDNTSKFFKLNNIDNLNESSLRPWHVNFLNSVDSHSWSRISK